MHFAKIKRQVLRRGVSSFPETAKFLRCQLPCRLRGPVTGVDFPPERYLIIGNDSGHFFPVELLLAFSDDRVD